MQAYRRLQKGMLSLSPRATLYLLDSLGENHDAPVVARTRSLIPRLKSSICNDQVCISVSITITSCHCYLFQCCDTAIVNMSLSFEDDTLCMFDEEVSETGTLVECTDSSTCSLFVNQGPLLASTPNQQEPENDSTMEVTAASSSLPSLDISCFTPESASTPTSQCLPPVCSPVVPPLTQASSTWQGFKIVGDNIDKNVKRRHQTLDRTTMSLHYFNSYAVADRVNFSSLSENKPDRAFDDELVMSLLPSDVDLQQILHNFEIHVSRILVKHLPPLKRLSEVTVKHISHMYSTEMSKKSLVVRINLLACIITIFTLLLQYPLGIQLKSENQMDEMVSIVDEVHK